MPVHKTNWAQAPFPETLTTPQHLSPKESIPSLDLLWIYLSIVNAASFLLMGFDKLSAKLDSERVPEMWFFLAFLAGGFGGTVLGMFAFHHKISKPSFQLKAGAAAVLSMLMLLFLVMRK